MFTNHQDRQKVLGRIESLDMPASFKRALVGIVDCSTNGGYTRDLIRAAGDEGWVHMNGAPSSKHQKGREGTKPASKSTERERVDKLLASSPLGRLVLKEREREDEAS